MESDWESDNDNPFDEEAEDDEEAGEVEEYADEPEMVAEVDVFSRVNMSGVSAILSDLGLGSITAEAHSRVRRRAKSDAERLAIDIVVVARDLDSQSGVSVSEDELVAVLTPIRQVQHPEAKNATAYLLGYFASGGGREITKEGLKKAEKLLLKTEKGTPTADDSLPAVTMTDVVRYARYWLSLE
jgi:hypothetical protein